MVRLFVEGWTRSCRYDTEGGRHAGSHCTMGGDAPRTAHFGRRLLADAKLHQNLRNAKDILVHSTFYDNI